MQTAAICVSVSWQWMHKPCVPKRPPFNFFELLCQKLTDFNDFGTLNPEKIWHEDLTDLSISPVRCSHFTLGNPKSHFWAILFIYFRLFTLPPKKTNSNCCTPALAVYLLLFSAPTICIAPVLRLGHATGGARVLIRTCWGLRQRLVATWAVFQHSVVYYTKDQCRKRLKACINAEGGHS